MDPPVKPEDDGVFGEDDGILGEGGRIQIEGRQFKEPPNIYGSLQTRVYFRYEQHGCRL
jgi:hypothetical protein